MEWISVESEMPRPYARVLLYAKRKTASGARFYAGYWRPPFDDGKHSWGGEWGPGHTIPASARPLITHWMPLPDPPTGK